MFGGCTFPPKQAAWQQAAPCKRADRQSADDQFEPREPYLIADGVTPGWFWW